jgi:uncharacterized repeat protein (TIGR01451 family)
MGRYVRVALAVAIGLVFLPVLAAHGSDIVAEYGEWTISGKTGTVEVPEGHFPVGNVTSDATRFRAFSGASTYLNSSTPPGQEFGSSKDHSYLQFSAVSATSASKTTITFARPAPAGDWTFVLGDIDADKAKIEATGANGSSLSSAELGWKGAFNYCESAPRPGSCTGGPPYTDEPVWDGSTATLTGNGPDTSGASGWFMPTKPVKSLTITYSVLTGIPVGQLWIAANWSQGKPDIVIDKHAYPTDVLPGGTVSFTITVTNKGDVDEPLASFRDDLSDVLDDADYLGDAHADGGTVGYQKPVLTWEGSVPPHETRTITYSVRIHDRVRGNGKIRNVVVGEGHRTTCQSGKGTGCGVTVHIAVTYPCRAALPAGPGATVVVTRYGC